MVLHYADLNPECCYIGSESGKILLFRINPVEASDLKRLNMGLTFDHVSGDCFRCDLDYFLDSAYS